MKPTDFTTPTSSLLLPVLNIANAIEACYGEYLIHPQEGYYLPHSLEPIPSELYIVNKTKTALIVQQVKINLKNFPPKFLQQKEYKANLLTS